jgi:hypothetical protein
VVGSIAAAGAAGTCRFTWPEGGVRSPPRMIAADAPSKAEKYRCSIAGPEATTSGTSDLGRLRCTPKPYLISLHQALDCPKLCQAMRGRPRPGNRGSNGCLLIIGSQDPFYALRGIYVLLSSPSQMANLRWHYAQLGKALGNMRICQWLKPSDSLRFASNRESAPFPFFRPYYSNRLGGGKLLVQKSSPSSVDTPQIMYSAPAVLLFLVAQQLSPIRKDSSE